MHRHFLIAATACVVFILLLPSVFSISSSYAEGVFFDEAGETDSFGLDEEEMNGFRNILDSLMGDAEDQPSLFGLWYTLHSLLSETKDSTLRDKIKELINGFPADSDSKGKRVLVFSHGRTMISNPMKRLQVRAIKPSTFFWYYSGDFDNKVPSKTYILDLKPMNVKVLDGRQVGMIRRFVGFYIYIPMESTHQSNVFFLGYAYQAVGMDLSPRDSLK